MGKCKKKLKSAQIEIEFLIQHSKLLSQRLREKEASYDELVRKVNQNYAQDEAARADFMRRQINFRNLMQGLTLSLTGETSDERLTMTRAQLLKLFAELQANWEPLEEIPDREK